MYGEKAPFFPGGGGRGTAQPSQQQQQQQQIQLNHNLFPNPNNLFFPYQNPVLFPHLNPFLQNSGNFPQFQHQLPNNSFNNNNFQNNNNNNIKFPQQPVKLQNETIEKLDKAVRKARLDFLTSKENVSAWKVSQAALLMVKAESWESLGFQMQQVPSLSRLLVTEGKINAFIHCFVAVRRITSLYDLEIAICESEGIERFEELELGPLLRHPLVVHYFAVTFDMTEVYKIRTEDIISYLFEFMETHSQKEVKVDLFMDFISMKQSVSGSEKLCVRIQNFGMYINQIKQARQSDDIVSKKCFEKMRTKAVKRSDNRPLYAQKKQLDEKFTVISQRIKSFSSENTQFCGKHIRFVSSSSEHDDSDDNEFKDNQDDKNSGSKCSLPLSNVKSDRVSSCPYPSATEEMTRLGLKSEAYSSPNTPDGGLRCNMENELSERKRRTENVTSSSSAPHKRPKRDRFAIHVKHKGGVSRDINDHVLSIESLTMFATTWKEACCVNNADEVLDRMLQFYNVTKKKKVKALFTKYPFVGLLNAAVSCIKIGICDNKNDNVLAISQQGVDSQKIKSSADPINIDVEPAEEGVAVSAHKTLPKKDVTVEDIMKKLSGYFEEELLSYKNRSQENKFSLLMKLCEGQYWIIEQYSINEFESLGYGEYLLFLEKYMYLLPYALQKCLMGGINEDVSLEARLLPLQLDVLLSQTFNSLRENELINLQTISELLSKQFPLVCFKLLKSDQMENFAKYISEKRCNLTSNCVLFSTPLLRLNCKRYSLAQNDKELEEDSGVNYNKGPREGMTGTVTTKDAIEVLLKAPMLTDLNLWSHWDLLFAPSLGSIVEWLFKEVNTKELLCLVTNDGKVIRLDHSATMDSFLKVFIQGSAFETAVELLSLFALYGGEQNVPLSLLKCHARQAFKVIISNSSEMESRDKNWLMHGKPSYDQFGRNTSSNLGIKLSNDKNILNKAVPVTSRFILDCLSYLPIEFCSFAADVLISGLQSFVKGVPSAILTECKQIEQRIILHEVGMSLGLVEWVNDYHSFLSSVTTGFSPSSSCLDVVTSKLNPSSMIVQDVLNQHPSSETNYNDVKCKGINGGAKAEVSASGSTSKNSEKLPVLDIHTDNDASRVIESIRKEEFGLDHSLSATENKMLEKQHARLGRALHCLSQELYSQDSHFLLELVQNADDNIYPENVEPTLTFILQEKGIIVLNNEKGFLANNIRALCDVGNSTKKGHNAGYIGKKGIGFKSVFRVTDAPEIHSNGFHIKFDISQGQIGFVLPTIVPSCDIDMYSRLASADADRMDQNSWNTCIVLPFRTNLTESFSMNNIASMFSDLHPSLLLFLHRLQCIRFRNLLDNSLLVMRKEVLGDGIVQVSLGNEKMTWFLVSKKLQDDVIRSDVQRTEISIAFTLQEIDGGYIPILDQQPVFAFLPLRTYGLRFILQGDFVLPSSREEVDGNSPWNQWLLSEFPDLFVSAERSFCDLPCYRGCVGKAVTTFMSFIPLVGEVHGFFSSLPRMIISKLRMSNCLVLDSDVKEWVPPCRVLRNWTEQTRSLLPDSLLREHLGLGLLNREIVLSDPLARALGVEDYGPKLLLRIISSLCRSENGLRSMGLTWLSSWLSAIYLMSSHSFNEASLCFGRDSDFMSDLQRIPFIPLSNGKFGSVYEDTIWLHSDAVDQGIDEYVLEAFQELYSKLRIVSPNLLAAASVESSISDTTIVENVTRMLFKVGVHRLSAHEIVKMHVLPAISNDRNAIGQENLMIEYLSFAMFHLQSSCTNCSIERDDIMMELREKALILTNYGYKRSNEESIHFNREYKNPVDVHKLISALDVKWHEVSTTYLKHPITKSLGDGVLKWRKFFQDLGITDFVQIVQTEKKVAEMSFVDLKDIICGKDMISVDSVAKNWDSKELFSIVSGISSRDDRKNSLYLMEILDSLWDDYFTDKLTGNCIDSTGKCKLFKSSIISIFQDVPWIVSNIDNKLHYPKDLFQDCVAVNSILGISAPYSIPKVRNEKLLADIGLRTEVTLDDALSVLGIWRRSESPFKASVSQMSNFYGFLWKGMALSKKKIIEELHSGPFIFVPYSSSCSHGDVVSGALLSPQEVYWHDSISLMDQVKSVHPESVAGTTTSTHRNMLYNLYPNLHNFFVNECGVNETPPLRNYLQILLQLSSTDIPHRAAKKVFEVFLRWADALVTGSLSLEDVEYVKESLFKREFTVLPTRQDKWVSLHSSFGLVCWCDDDNLGREFKHLEGVDFLYFGESTDVENEMLRAKIVTREAIYYGPDESSFLFSLVNWILPYAQRYMYNTHPNKYFQLKQSSFENLRQLKIIAVEKLFYRNVIKRVGITSKKRYDCNCLLQGNILYCSSGSDPHSIFLEFSRLLYNGTQELNFANFLHMITTMAESGSTQEQTEFFILNSQKIQTLPAEESSWSLQSVENDVTAIENYLPQKVEEQNLSVFKKRPDFNSNWPPADWKTAPGFSSASAFGLKKPVPEATVELRDILTPTEMNSEFNIESDNIVMAPLNTENLSESQFNNLSNNLGVNVNLNVVLNESNEVLADQAKLTGRLGELVAYKYFVGKVGDEVSVKWVNEANETGLPYDIIIGGSDEEDSTSREYIEVKATKFGRKNWFVITMREWQFAIEKGESFSIVHVVLGDDNMAKVAIYKNPARLCQLGNLKLAIVVPKE
ncbi:hypothetical protein RD792_009742 [Penstemon davidsonii]|uniref:Protein NO VEIN C-terminal domain-containing protein n=1 Tax=Penstemon davidsonii TaxID=160366 RepID=A0ABR0D0P3_9LAMI|nr:hypothetical protein RD792_009742 [Penstemon davidsonii]